MTRLVKDGIRWEIQPGFESLPDEILSSQIRVVKESPVKRVSFHSARGSSFYVKRYRHSAVRLRPLDFFFKPSQARQEWKLAQQLEALKIPIVRHLAIGERWSGRGLEESILITEEFPGKPLEELPNCDPQAVLDFVNAMHERGALQRDLHPGNILVAGNGEMRLVDLHGTEIKSSLTPAERSANLAFLNIFFPLPVSREIQRTGARLRKRYFALRSKRCLFHNREFAPKRIGELNWQMRLPFLNSSVENILRDPDGFLARRAAILKPGRSSTVGKADGLVLKRYNFRKFENLVKDLFRASKARRAFRKAYHLELVGIPTARPIATSDKRAARVLSRSYFLMVEIPGAVDLGKWNGDRRHAIRSLAELLAKLHNEGFSHRDLKETNIVFDQSRRANLIDLEGLEYLETVPADRAEADLARLMRGLEQLPQFGKEEREEFFKLYRELRERGLD